MKKVLLACSLVGFLTTDSQASLILSNSFAYPDGSLTNVSAGSPLGVWTNHSGSGTLEVSGEKVVLSQGSAPDVSSGLPGGPYSSGTLFASFNVNFSEVPTAGTPQYFFHFRDTGTSNFRGKIFATNSLGATRIGVSVGGVNTPAVIPTDLILGTEYKVVLRYNIDTTNATLWINPTSESSIVNRADATDTTSSRFSYYSVCFRQTGGIGGMTIDDLLIGTTFSDVQTIGGPPSISGLVNVSIPANSNTGPLPFLISDVETPAASLTVSASSDNTTLVPNNPANLTFGGSGANRTLTVTPAIGQEGVANIQAVVTDGSSFTATNNFSVTVGLPTISSVSNQIALTNTVTGPLVFTVADNETAAGSLTVTATSSDQLVLPDANIAIVNGGNTRSVYLTNSASGFTTVTVTVNDGVFNVPTTFILTAYPANGILLADDFAYPDGSITLNSSSLWTTHSAATGQTGQTQVVTGKLFLDNAGSEDINRWFTNAPVPNTGGQLIYTRFIVNLSALPTANGVGEYFTHIYGFSGAFRARVFASTNGAAAGKYRLAISSSSFTPVAIPQDFSLNESHVVISRYNTATAETTLWVDPASELSPGASATDSSSSITAYGIAFRQSTGIGSMSIDDLVVGSTFADVFVSAAPTPIPLAIQTVGSDVQLTWTNPQFNLQAAPAVTGTYTNVPGATSPYTTPVSGEQRYFRLAYP
jgi:hypothetical protein